MSESHVDGVYYSEAYAGWHALLLRRDVGNAAFMLLLQRCAATKDVRSASRRGCKVAVLAPWLPFLYKCYYLVQDGHKKPSHVHRWAGSRVPHPQLTGYYIPSPRGTYVHRRVVYVGTS